MRARLNLLSSCVLAAALLLAGCSGGDDDAAGPADPAVAGEAADGETDLDGGAADEAAAADGAAADGAADDGDEEGGIGVGEPTPACSLLDAAEVAEVTGLDVLEGEESTATAESICDWRSADGSQNVVVKVRSMTEGNFPDGDSADDAYAAFRDLAGDVEDVPGIGDAAHYDGPMGFVVLADADLITFNVFAVDVDQVGLAQQLAARALGGS